MFVYIYFIINGAWYFYDIFHKVLFSPSLSMGVHVGMLNVLYIKFNYLFQ